MRKSANRKAKHNTRRANKHRPSAGTRVRIPAVAPVSPQRMLPGRNQGLTAAAAASADHAASLAARSVRSAFGWLRRTPEACARALPIAREEREIAVLLLAPFFILAVAIAGNQSLQLGKHLRALIARPVPPATLPSQTGIARDIVARPVMAIEGRARPAATHPEFAATWLKAPTHQLTPHSIPEFVAYPASARAPLPPTASAPTQSLAALAPETLPTRAAVASDWTMLRTTDIRPLPLAQAAPEWSTATWASRTFDAAATSPLKTDEVIAFDEQRDVGTRRTSLYERCTVPATSSVSAATTGAAQTLAVYAAPIAPATWFTPGDTPSFGQRLAAAARRQIDEFVVYDDAYRSIAYPRGDVPSLYGVCTDVVIRAYRDLGIDLQVAVQKARVGSGDRNIDHRRTETLRRFFQRAGVSLPVTTYAEDYLPGDIVTYTRPQNTGRSSRSHIAMVSDVIAPSGRPMIIHNRGWGPQLEDALFVDRITGHYRFSGSGGASPARQPPMASPRLPDRHAAQVSPPPAPRARTAAASRTLR